MSLLEVRDLRTRFETDRGDVHAVDGISFDIDPGEVFGIVGESGSGKSVTALSVMGLVDSPGVVEAESIAFDGREMTRLSEPEMREIRGGDISMVFQDPMNSLNPVMTVGEQIAEVVRHHDPNVGESTGLLAELGRKYVTGTDTESASWQRAIELLNTVGIPDPEERATDYPHQLSGGMRQRVVIAQALAGDPDLIIADEPTTALDVSVEAQILSKLLELAEEFGVSIVLITHDLAVIRETCDRVAVMYAGEIMETAEVAELFDNPSHPYTQGLLSSIPRIDDDREWLDAIEGNVPNLIDKPDGCPFRPRCDHAFEMCDQPLEPYEVGENHDVWCHLHHEAVTTDAENNVVDAPAETVSANMGGSS